MVVAGNDPIGHVDIGLASLSDKIAVRKWYTLTDASTHKPGSCGEIEVALRHRFNPELASVFFEEPDAPDKPANELRIAVVAARRLKVMDKNMFSKGGSSDPLVRLTVNKREFTTEVKKNSCDPRCRREHHVLRGID